MRSYILALMALVIVILLAINGCADNPPCRDYEGNGEENKQCEVPISDENDDKDDNNAKEPVVEDNRGPFEPNEAGQVMILMYHRFGETEGEWQRTWDNFKSDIERLYDEGYRLVSIKDYLNNTIDLPAGYSPVILTFDDGYNNQFDIKKEGDQWELEHQTAVGIMHDFYQQHPDFGLEGVFYVNSQPFSGGSWKEACQYLVNVLGMDIGNHTRTHINLSKHTPERIAEEVGGLVLDFSEVLPEYQIDSLALPYGVSQPGAVSLSGQYQGIDYDNKGVLLVGANPAPATITKEYNPLRIPRIRGDEENLAKWLEYFNEHPHLRYVSDGDPDVITIPMDMLDSLSEDTLQDEALKLYDRGIN